MSATSNKGTGRAPRTDIAAIEQQLSAEAENIRQTISSGGAPKISISRAGQFTGPDGLDMGTEIRGVVVEYISANRYYPHQFDPANPAPPVCFAFGKKLNEMAPAPEAPEPQADACTGCPMNEFGSKGKGKACKNTRELAFILEEDLEAPEPRLYLISVPPTAIKSFDAFANLCSRVLSGPPIKAVVSIKAVPQGTYTTMVFSDPDNNPNYAEHFGLRDEALALISQLPNMDNYVPSAPARAAARQATPRRAAAR
jgi:hypothetical protein